LLELIAGGLLPGSSLLELIAGGLLPGSSLLELIAGGLLQGSSWFHVRGGNHNKQYKLCHVNYAQLHEYNCSV
jgi:hypothetical protein